MNLSPLFKVLGIPEWDGKAEQKPVEGKLFVFRGKLYKWEKCPCKNPMCKRPLVYTAVTHIKSAPMTYRMRGTDTGDPTVNILAKVLGTEVVVDAMEKEGPRAKESLFALATSKINAQRDPAAFLEAVGVTEEDLFGALLTSL